MKKNVVTGLLGLSLAVVLFSCSKDDEEISVEAGIIGIWTVESADILIEGKSLEAYIEEIMPTLIEQWGEEGAQLYLDSFSDLETENEFVNTTIEFREDKSAITTDENGSKNGSWSVSGKQLTVIFDNEPQTFEVRSLTNSHAALYLAFEEEGMESPLNMEVIMNLKK